MANSYAKTNINSTTVQITINKKTVAFTVWDNFLKVNSILKIKAQRSAEDKWGVKPMDWYIYRSKDMEAYSQVYEFIYNSAQIHKISPEFLHSVVMGEGLHLFLEDLRSNKTPYDSMSIIDAYAFLGADEIGDNIDSLIKNGYISTNHKSNIVPKKVQNELNEIKTSAYIQGFETGIEVVAAELHQRCDWIKKYISDNKITVDLMDSDTIDYLTYATYNSMSVGVEAAKNITHYMRKFQGTERTDQRNVRFNTLKRLATSDWYKIAKVYNV